MAGPFDGVRIIDATTMLSGPWSTMILADQGAEVIKIEVPGKGDHVRSLGNQRGGMSSMFLNINRNKKSVAVNLKEATGIQILKSLVRTADIFIQNFRPGVMDRLGLGYDVLKELNPRLVYVSVSGFGDVGPWSGKPVYDPVIQAVSGLTAVQGGGDNLRRRLIKTVLPDKLAAVTCAQSMSAALFAREKTGEGQLIKLSMLDSILYFLWASDMGAQTYPHQEAAPQNASSFVDIIYETKDSYMTVAVMSNKEWKGVCTAMGRPEWLADERFSTPSARDNHVNERLTMTQEVLKTKTTAEWMALFEQHDVPCSPALTRREVVEHPQVIASGILTEYDHPTAGRLRQTRAPAIFEKTPAEIRNGAPLLGENGNEILKELGYSDKDMAKLREDGVLGAEPAVEKYSLQAAE